MANAPLDHAAGRWDAVVHLPGIAARIPPLDLDAASAHLAAATTRRHLRARALGRVLQADPACSPLLALSDNPYTALACPPRAHATGAADRCRPGPT